MKESFNQHKEGEKSMNKTVASEPKIGQFPEPQTLDTWNQPREESRLASFVLGRLEIVDTLGGDDEDILSIAA